MHLQAHSHLQQKQFKTNAINFTYTHTPTKHAHRDARMHAWRGHRCISKLLRFIVHKAQCKGTAATAAAAIVIFVATISL